MTASSAANVIALPSADPQRAASFEAFLAVQREALVAFLRHRTAGEADAQDAAQEAMARLVRYRDRGPESAWKPLLYRIAINVAHDQARDRHTRRAEAHVPLDGADVVLVAAQPSHEQRLDDERRLAVIRELLFHLPERCRQIYLLNRVEGMSYSEIARHCGISVKAVEKHIAKALKRLRRGLGERGWSA